jgi:putative hydrolase of the HAD superfamily
MPEARTGLVVDYGGVLTTNLFDSFGAFCADEGIDPDTVRKLFRHDEDARQLLIDLETGALELGDFETRFGAMLGVDDTASLSVRMMRRAGPDDAMLDAVRRARASGVRTGLLSNSWGVDSYDRALLDELFDGVVLSGEEGIRKPSPEIYALACERVGLAPDQCVFVDDLPFNLKPALQLGMATVLHKDSGQTISELEELLGVGLG